MVKVRFCAVCGAKMICVNEDNLHEAREAWEELLKAGGDANNYRTLVLEGEIFDPVSESVPYEYREYLKVLSQKKKELSEKYIATDDSCSFFYNGLPTSVRVTMDKGSLDDLSISRITMVYAKLILSEENYNQFKDCQIITEEERICPSCKTHTKFCSEFDFEDFYKECAEESLVEIKKKSKKSEKNSLKNEFSMVNEKEYLKYLVEISDNILFLEKWYQEIVIKEGDSKRIIMKKQIEIERNTDVAKEQEKVQKRIDDAINDEKKKLDKLGVFSQDEVIEILQKNLVNILVEPLEPQKPTQPNDPFYEKINEEKLIAPQKPELLKASLFNKKKIQIENEEIQSQYAISMVDYENEIAKLAINENRKNQFEAELLEFEIEKKLYEKKLSEYSESKSKYDKQLPEYNKIKDAVLESETKKIIESKKLIILERVRSLEKEKEDIEFFIKEDSFTDYLLTSNSEYASAKKELDFLENEANEVVDLLMKQYQLLGEILELNVIFPKYSDIVAWSTMYEYFETGRVTELSGTNGAYNLFESEMRANTVISKLDIIIDQLEAIKGTQFIIYQLIKKANELLSDMKSSLINIDVSAAKANNLLECIYSTQQGIEYQTKKIAAYSEITAKSTAAVAYMTFIRR